MAKAEYIVGIDLGTTNIVVTTIPLSESENPESQISTFEILQEQPKGSVEKLKHLPSFIFERLKEKPVLPWEENSNFIIGEYARERGSEVPDRLISSAKSWLSNTKIDRKLDILPFNAPEGTTKVSPLKAVTLFFTHIKNAWNEEMGKKKLENQQVIVTIPASFDAAARDLTVEAAAIAGLNDIALLEEPQAAFYSWIYKTDWRKQVKKGDLVVVVDVGGGTTDFSLIEIGESEGDLSLKRVAVGNHILLGGDNMDLTLAYIAASKLEKESKKVSQWQIVQLAHQCRKAKEILLSDLKKDSVPIVISGRGKSVIAGSIKTTIDREDIDKNLLEGFFPICEMDAKLAQKPSIGIREQGLMYSPEPAITKHLAAFLTSQNQDKEQYGYPQAILFNGGVFYSPLFKERLVEVINDWLSNNNKPQLKVLEGYELENAVAHGASYYGMVRNGNALRIRGGVSQSYYLGIESSMPAVPGFAPPLKALCVAKQGTEEGTVSDLKDRFFTLITGEKVEFKFFKSNCRRDDEFGDIIDEIDESFEEMNALNVELPISSDKQTGVDVAFQIAITEIGTLEVFCLAKESDERWKLEFNVRDSIV